MTGAYEAVRVIVAPDGRYEWTDLSDPPRPPAQLPKDDGLGFGLHATTPPARWRIDWYAVANLAAWLLAGGIWALAIVGISALWGRG